MEDGVGEYVPWAKKGQKPFFLLFHFWNKFLKINKSRIRILQLAKSRTEYFKNLNQPFLRQEYYFDNRKSYKNFIKNNFEKQLSFKPKCILIGTNPMHKTSISEENNFDYLKNLYTETVLEVKKDILIVKIKFFFFHIQEQSYFIVIVLPKVYMITQIFTLYHLL